MFRECYFEYAGISSEIYDLKLVYVSNSNDTFLSGGEYEIKTDTLPKIAEQILYGIDYSSKPLEFDIEIANLNRDIPFDQLMEIKNWLFGQDGWKIFKTLDDRQDYHLKCLLVPQEDIVDGSGYRGFKCKLKNISSFWYGQEHSLIIPYDVLHGKNVQSRCDGQYYWVPFTVDIPKSNAIDSYQIYPMISFSLSQGIGSGTSDFEEFNSMSFGQSENAFVDIGTVDYTDIDSFISQYYSAIPSVEGYIPESNPNNVDKNASELLSGIKFDLPGQAKYYINTQYAQVSLKNLPYVLPCKAGVRLFNLKVGTNICYLRNPENIKSLTISYTPMYRIGAF